MSTESLSDGWEGALRSFLIHLQAVRSPKTVRFYRIQRSGIASWAAAKGIGLHQFVDRHLDECLVERAELGRRETTRHHDELAAKVFCKWSRKNGFLKRDPLKDRKLRNPAQPHKHIPTEAEIRSLLRALQHYYDISHNPSSSTTRLSAARSTGSGRPRSSWSSWTPPAGSARRCTSVSRTSVPPSARSRKHRARGGGRASFRSNVARLGWPGARAQHVALGPTIENSPSVIIARYIFGIPYVRVHSVYSFHCSRGRWQSQAVDDEPASSLP